MSDLLAPDSEKPNTAPPVSDPTTRHRPHRPGRTTFWGRVGAFCRHWWPEILIGLLVALGIFLLVERMSIRQTLLAWMVALGHGLTDLFSAVVASAVERVRSTTLSDLIAYGMFLVVLGLAAWRTRQRLMTTPRFIDLHCPRCGSDLHRIHRHGLDRLLDLYVPVRRYSCASHDCRWRGLRVKRRRHG